MYSCSNSEKMNENEAANRAKDSLMSELDTFYIGTKFFALEQITKADFDKLPYSPELDSSEKNIFVRFGLRFSAWGCSGFKHG